MNKHWEKTIFAALSAHDAQDMGVDLSALALFADFASSEAVLAAFIDESLTADQADVVKLYLANNFALRQQWRDVLYAMNADVSVTNKVLTIRQNSRATSRLTQHWGRLAGIAAGVAAVAIFISFERGVEQTSLVGSAQSIDNSGVLIDGGKDTAPVLANQAVPLNFWRFYLAAYTQGRVTERVVGVDSNAALFGKFTQTLLTLDGVACEAGLSAERIMRLDALLAQLIEQYPSEFSQFKPLDGLGWCGVAKKIQQYAELAVSMIN